jgi:hypothetical protein
LENALQNAANTEREKENIINQKTTEIESLRELTKNENAAKTFEIVQLQRAMIELKVIVT